MRKANDREKARIAPREVEDAAKVGKKLSLLNARIEARYFRKIVRKLAR